MNINYIVGEKGKHTEFSTLLHLRACDTCDLNFFISIKSPPNVCFLERPEQAPSTCITLIWPSLSGGYGTNRNYGLATEGGNCTLLHEWTVRSLQPAWSPLLLSQQRDRLRLQAEEHHPARPPVIIRSRLAGSWPFNCSINLLSVFGGCGNYFVLHCL